MPKETILATSQNQYLLDAENSERVDEWLRKVESGEDKVDSFIECFPNDGTVLDFQEGRTTLEKLKIHVAIVASKLPTNQVFAAHGITEDVVLDRLRTLMASPKDFVALGAVRLVLPYLYPEEKPLRVQAQQTNTFNVYDEDAKAKLLESIRNKVDRLDAIDADSRPTLRSK